MFYPYTTIIHPERLRFDYPAIVVSNHPNTLLDPLNVAARVKKVVFFLANAGLFSSGFGNWFFNTFYCIPVQRPQDKGGKRGVSNEESFARAADHLTEGGVLFIAPEGTSEMERRLRPIKTGTARISLITERRNDFQLGMAIVPVGLTYAAPDRCGSRLVVHVGEPIFPQTYREAYEAQPIETARQLTDDLEERLRGLLIDTLDEEEDQRLRQLEAMLQSQQPLAGAARFQREQRLLQRIRASAQSSWPLLLDQYRKALRDHELIDRAVATKGSTSGADMLVALLGFPFFLYGRINNFLPFEIPRWLARKLDLYRGYDATVKILAGMITFPLFYWLQSKLIAGWWGDTAGWLYLLSLPISAWWAWRYAGLWRRVRYQRNFRKLSPEARENLVRLRTQILDVAVPDPILRPS